jgi:hypothetical protein
MKKKDMDARRLTHKMLTELRQRGESFELRGYFSILEFQTVFLKAPVSQGSFRYEKMMKKVAVSGCFLGRVPAFGCADAPLLLDYVNPRSLAPRVMLKAVCLNMVSMMFLMMVVNRARLARSWR